MNKNKEKPRPPPLTIKMFKEDFIKKKQVGDYTAKNTQLTTSVRGSTININLNESPLNSSTLGSNLNTSTLGSNLNTSKRGSSNLNVSGGSPFTGLFTNLTTKKT